MLHQLFIDSKKANDSVNNPIEFGTPKKIG
jgi:hypothetical protein